VLTKPRRLAAAEEDDMPTNTPTSATPQLPADALFQVGDQQPVPLEHLAHVNPDLVAEDKVRLSELRVGKALELAQDGRVVRVRRTR
jgi:hypothetical protein